jgi:glycosyltransferase involved in cell wall biosynthesis
MKTLVVYQLKELVEGTTGSSANLNEIMQSIKSLGEIVALIPAEDPIRSEHKTLQGFWSRTYEFYTRSEYFTDFSISYWRQIRSVIGREKPDLILISFLPGILTLILANRRRSKLVYFAHVFEYDFRPLTMSRVIRLPARLTTYILELFACKFSDHIISVSSEDRDKISRVYGVPPSKIAVVQLAKRALMANPAESKSSARSKIGLPGNAPIVLFHGTMTHFPNREAVQRIVSCIAPLVEKKDPAIRFAIAGAGTPESSNGNVVSLGFVSDLNALLDSADLAIMPIATGGGVRMKMIDYMSRGVPTIATSTAMEGIDYSDRREVVIAKTDEDFAERIMELVKNHQLAEEIGQNARDYAVRHFALVQTERTMFDMLDKLGIH